MSSKLLINVNDASPIVVPDTDAPDTGMFSVTHHDGVNTTSNMIAPIISISVLLVVLIALIVGLAKKHKSKKINNFSIYSRRHTILRITSIMTLILITTFVALNFNTKQEDNVNAASNTLTLTTSDIEIDVDLKDKAVFATGESVVTVDSATEAGYTLLAYVDSTTTDLTNETNTSSTSTISMLESTYSKALEDNTWGMAITKPTSQDDTLFRGLPTAEKDAMTIKATSDATTASDKSTFYYSTYITPDLDFGTYSGATITYIAVANVVEDDVTVNYHLDDGGRDATDEINTVTYNKSYELAYMGDNCGTSYVGTEPAAIVKTNNLNDNGVQNGAYLPIIGMEPITVMGDMAYVVAYQVVNIPGADGIKIDIDYKITGAYIMVLKGGWAVNEIISEDIPTGVNPDALAESQVIIPINDPVMEGEKEFTFSGDAITVLAIGLMEPVDGYDYGLFAKLYPIFAEQPENVTTSEKTACYSVKSSEIYNTWDENTWLFPVYSYQVLIPGADKIKMEIDYRFSPGLLLIAEGSTGVVNLFLGAMPPTIYLYADYGENISGHKEIFMDGNLVTFMIDLEDGMLEGRDFEFDIKLYPVYNDEHENTVPVAMDTIVEKTGSYSESVRHVAWRYYFSNDEDRSYSLLDEESVELLINSNYDDFAGQTIDIYEGLY